MLSRLEKIVCAGFAINLIAIFAATIYLKVLVKSSENAAYSVSDDVIGYMIEADRDRKTEEAKRAAIDSDCSPLDTACFLRKLQ